MNSSVFSKIRGWTVHSGLVTSWYRSWRTPDRARVCLTYGHTGAPTQDLDRDMWGKAIMSHSSDSQEHVETVEAMSCQ